MSRTGTAGSGRHLVRSRRRLSLVALFLALVGIVGIAATPEPKNWGDPLQRSAHSRALLVPALSLLSGVALVCYCLFLPGRRGRDDSPHRSSQGDNGGSSR